MTKRRKRHPLVEDVDIDEILGETEKEALFG